MLSSFLLRLMNNKIKITEKKLIEVFKKIGSL